MRSILFIRLALAGALATLSFGALAASEIEASGYTDLDGDFVLENVMRDLEPAIPNTPFARSIVGVESSGSNYAYSASSDIGLLELKAFAQIDNTGDTTGQNLEIGIVNAFAELDDEITLESLSLDPYDVTIELAVEGLLSFDGGDGLAQAQLNFGPNPGFDGFDSRFWTTSQLISDTLSVTQTFTGNVTADVGALLLVRINDADPGAILTGELSNTATLRLILPAGVTVSGSASGTFNEVIAPIPIPGALPLFASGLAGLFYCSRRFRVRRWTQNGNS